MKLHAIALALCGIATLTLLNGCAGYQLGSTKPEAFAHIDSIWVPTFNNETLEPRLAVLTTNSVISKLQQDGTYKITNKDSADVALRGTITKIERRQQRSTNTNILRTRELMVTLEVEFYLEDLTTGRKIEPADPFGVDRNQVDAATGRRRSGNRVVGRTTLFLDPNLQTSEREAFPLAAEDAAEQIVSSISEGW